jgi:uncharacterized protein YkwD
MRPARIAAACVACCVLMALPAPAQAKPRAGKMMLEQINKKRAARGLPALRKSPSLRRSSGRFARWLMRHDLFAHRGRVSASRRFDRLGEALAMHSGRKPRVRRTLRMWLRSPTHRKLVLGRGRNYIGVGMARGRFRGRRAVIWVLQVGKL